MSEWEELLAELELDPEGLLNWLRRHRTTLLLSAAILATLVMLAPAADSPDRPPADTAPDETPLFV